MRIYLDNAATTPLSREVFLAMEPYLFEHFGNASSAHRYGRQANAAITQSRHVIAELLNTAPGNIIFTSGGTESDNTAILSAVKGNGIKLAITSRLEHHAVLNTLKTLEKNGELRLVYLRHDDKGNLSLPHLQQLLEANDKAFVSLMHGNNELGNLNDIEEISAICSRYGAVFHSDTVQTMGHYHYDTKTLKADFFVGSAHKFHGPKGVGFLYKRDGVPLLPHISGGGQENGQRGGTENVAGIAGLAKALEIACRDRVFFEQNIAALKQRMINRLKTAIPGITFNGNSAENELSLNSVLSVSLPDSGFPEPVLDYLDRNQICASGGSACNSHTKGGSHVLNALGASSNRDVIRFSFSRYNTAEEVDYAADKLTRLFLPVSSTARPQVYSV